MKGENEMESLTTYVILILIAWVISCVVYFIPSIVAARVDKKNLNAIMALNFLTGWTLIGWVASFVWSLTKD